MQLKTIISAIASASVIAGVALADDNYVSLSGGLSIQDNSNNSGTFDGVFTTGAGTTIPGGTALPANAPVSWATQFENGYVVNGAIGRRFGSLRGELEVGYQSSGVQSHGNVRAGGIALANEDAGVLITGSSNLGVTLGDLVADGQGDLSTLFLMANMYYDLETGTSFRPYVGVGAGVGFVDVAFSPSAVGIIDDNTTSFAYQAMAGVAYEVSPMVEIYAGYRYRATLDAEVNVSLFPATLDVENRSSNVEGGIRVSF